MNQKGYNNPKDWEQFEQEGLQPKIINTEEDDFDVIEEVEIENEEEVENLDETSSDNDDFSSEENFDEVTTSDEKSDDDFSNDATSEENFDEVLQLTEYNGGLVSNTSTDFVVAEYDKIDTLNIDKKQLITAKKFVSKITKFILDFNDVQLTEAHKNYIRQVGQLQLDNLKDLLSLVEINKQMINNIVARVNATQAEDYAIINSYNNLINQHIKLIKELSNMYKSIPSVMKKMRADILTNQELENNTDNEEVVTEDYGETQFNNSKQMLRSILEKRKQKNNESNNQ